MHVQVEGSEAFQLHDRQVLAGTYQLLHIIQLALQPPSASHSVLSNPCKPRSQQIPSLQFLLAKHEHLPFHPKTCTLLQKVQINMR